MAHPAIIVGVFEQIAFPQFGIDGIKAKIDTGAYTGALHCTQISEEETEKGKVLRFAPFDHPEVTITADEFIVSHVKSSNGKREKRYFIQTTITIQGNTYPITLSLANRSEMKWPVLIGRRFLRANHFLVDVNKTA
jgi:hypothetical protein